MCIAPSHYQWHALATHVCHTDPYTERQLYSTTCRWLCGVVIEVGYDPLQVGAYRLRPHASAACFGVRVRVDEGHVGADLSDFPNSRSVLRRTACKEGMHLHLIKEWSVSLHGADVAAVARSFAIVLQIRKIQIGAKIRVDIDNQSSSGSRLC